MAGYVDIPGRIKAAVAVTCNEIAAKGVADRIRYTAGSVSREYAHPSFIGEEAARLLAPFVVRTYS